MIPNISANDKQASFTRTLQAGAAGIKLYCGEWIVWTKKDQLDFSKVQVREDGDLAYGGVNIPVS